MAGKWGKKLAIHVPKRRMAKSSFAGGRSRASSLSGWIPATPLSGQFAAEIAGSGRERKGGFRWSAGTDLEESARAATHPSAHPGICAQVAAALMKHDPASGFAFGP